MLLWTWQNPKVSPIEGEYDSLKYSYYVNDPNIHFSEKQRFINAYKRIWERLGHDKNSAIKILWCYTNEQEAKKSRGINENKVLWKIDVPTENIRYICDIAWHWILRGRNGLACTPPERLFKLYHTLTKGFRDQFDKDFTAGWRTTPENVLWDILFLNDLVEDCTTAIVIHPVRKTWFKEGIGFDEV